jgi:hypothetical protein
MRSRVRHARLAKWAVLLTLLPVAACAGSGDDTGTAPTVTTTARETGSTPPAATATTTRGSAVGVTTSTLAPPSNVLYAYDGGFTEGWQNYGWSATTDAPGPALLELAEWGGFILHGPGISESVTALTFQVRVAEDIGVRFLRVKLGSDDAEYPELRPDLSRTEDPNVLLAVVPIQELLGGKGFFDRIVISAALEFKVSTVVQIDKVGFIPGDPDAGVEYDVAAVRSRVECSAAPTPISPYIYGSAFRSIGDQSAVEQWDMGITARRWGGNTTSRYNWRSGHFWNTAADYFFRNVSILSDVPNAHEQFLMDNWSHGAASAVTVPTLGWVAKDDTSYSFPVSQFGEQEMIDPDVPDAGNGLSPDGDPLTPPDPSQTSIPSTPADVEEWVRSMTSLAQSSGQPSPLMYFLDNEPELWSDTHRDVRTDAIGYDELLSLTKEYAPAIRRADPNALIAGPSPWGWPAYFRSGKDQFADNDKDRKAHGDQPLLEWYLDQVRMHEQQTGERLLDVLDVHFYPQDGIYAGGQGKTDPETSARRIRSTRALWDPDYKDESYIDAKVMLIPRLKQLIDEHDPGLKLSLGEYSWGAERHMSGGLAEAEVLGRFGQQGLFSAYYWTRPPADSPTYWAFRAYRNYDGAGAQFLDLSLPTSVDDPDQLSVFASTNGDASKYVMVLLNFSPDRQLDTTVDLAQCAAHPNVRAFSYDGDPGGFTPSTAQLSGQSLAVALPPYSMTVVELS